MMGRSGITASACLLAGILAAMPAFSPNASAGQPFAGTHAQWADDTSEFMRPEIMTVSGSDDRILSLLQSEEFSGLEELARLPREEVIPVLTERAAKDSDPLIRQRSVIALGRIGDAGAIPALERGLKDRSVPVVLRSIEALARMGHEPSAIEITGLLQSDDPSIRESAAEALGVLSNPESEAALRQRLQKETDAFVRNTIEKSLDAIKADSGVSR